MNNYNEDFWKARDELLNSSEIVDLLKRDSEIEMAQENGVDLSQYSI